jgi:heat-inducible transcriptional repressor
MTSALNDRSREILRGIIEEYLRTGIPVGSRTLSHSLGLDLSPATIRNVMADLEDAELLFAPHTSAGRQPTEKGLRVYVDTLMKVGNLRPPDKGQIDTRLANPAGVLSNIYGEASALLSNLSSCVGLVIAPKMNKPVRQIQFLKMEPRRVLAILITQDELVENRMLTLESDVGQEDLARATEYLNNRIAGKTVGEIRGEILQDIKRQKDHLNALSARLVEDGIIAPLSAPDVRNIHVQGQSQLFNTPEASEKLEEIRKLFGLLEEQETFLHIMDAVRDGSGVQIFIGRENRVFDQPGWSTVIKAYHDPNGRIIGATGVIGPTRLDYQRIVTLVDYTSHVMERLLDAHRSPTAFPSG